MAPSWRLTVLKRVGSTKSTTAYQCRLLVTAASARSLWPSVSGGSTWASSLLMTNATRSPTSGLRGASGSWQDSRKRRDQVSLQTVAVLLPPRWRTRATAMETAPILPSGGFRSGYYPWLCKAAPLFPPPTSHRWSFQKLRSRTFKRQDIQCCGTGALGWLSMLFGCLADSLSIRQTPD